MDHGGLSASDWINIVIAGGVIATAVFTAMTAFAAREQARRSAPLIEFEAPKADPSPLRRLTVRIIPPDHERFVIARLSVPWPSKARLISTQDRLDRSGRHVREPSEVRMRSASIPPGESRVELFLDPAGSDEVAIRVHIALRADSSAKSRFTIRIRTKD